MKNYKMLGFGYLVFSHFAILPMLMEKPETLKFDGAELPESELMKSGRLLARAKRQTPIGLQISTYLALPLLCHIFKYELFERKQHRYNSDPDQFKPHPVTKEPFVETIDFYALDEDNKYCFIGTDRELHTDPTSPISCYLRECIEHDITQEEVTYFLERAQFFFDEGIKNYEQEVAYELFKKALGILRTVEYAHKDRKTEAILQIKFAEHFLYGLGTPVKWERARKHTQKAHSFADDDEELVAAYTFDHELREISTTQKKEAFACVTEQTHNLSAKGHAHLRLGQLLLEHEEDYERGVGLMHLNEAFKQTENPWARIQAALALGKYYLRTNFENEAVDHFFVAYEQSMHEETSIEAAFYLAKMFYHGPQLAYAEFTRNYRVSFDLFKKLARQGINVGIKEESMLYLALMYRYDIVVEADNKKVRDIYNYLRARASNYIIRSRAKLGLATCALYGLGMETDTSYAHRLFTECANQSYCFETHLKAKIELGKLLFNKAQNEHDYQTAFEYFTQAVAQSQNPAYQQEACYYLALMHLFGLYVPESRDIAHSVLSKVAHDTSDALAQQAAQEMLEKYFKTT